MDIVCAAKIALKKPRRYITCFQIQKLTKDMSEINKAYEKICNGQNDELGEELGQYKGMEPRELRTIFYKLSKEKQMRIRDLKNLNLEAKKLNKGEIMRKKKYHFYAEFLDDFRNVVSSTEGILDVDEMGLDNYDGIRQEIIDHSEQKDYTLKFSIKSFTLLN